MRPNRTLETSVMDALMDQPLTANDLAKMLTYSVNAIQRCLRNLEQNGLIECTGRAGAVTIGARIWRMRRTRKAA